MTIDLFTQLCQRYVPMRLPAAECRVYEVGSNQCLQLWDREANRLVYMTTLPNWIVDGCGSEEVIGLLEPLIELSSRALSDVPSPALAALN